MASLLINQGTNAAVFFEDVSGTAYRQSVAVDHGTITANLLTGTINVGTVTLTNPTGTTIQFNNGTIDLLKAGTITKLEGGTLGNLVSGTINAATAILNSGTINVGTFVMPSGTLTTGTIAEITNLLAGSVRIVNGTIQAGTVGGKGASGAAISGNPIPVGGTDSGGTMYGFLTDTKGQMYLGGGTIAMLNAGTISVLPNLPQGSINVTAGTFRLNPTPTQVTSSYGTTTTGTIGTLVAAPSAGSAIFITALDVNVQSGTAEALVSFGLVTGGNGVISRGNFVAGGGVAKTFSIPNSASITGSALTFNILSGSGTISYNVAYFVAVP